jgi:hypothetical protein
MEEGSTEAVVKKGSAELGNTLDTSMFLYVYRASTNMTL